MFCHVRAKVFLQHVIVLGVHISIISFFFLVTGRMFVSDRVWRCIPVSVKPDLGELISTLIAKV